MRIRSRAKVVVRGALRRAGLDLVRFLDPSDLLRRRVQLLERRGIDVVFDVGANVGQYATTMRALGFGGTIVSFEPSVEAYAHLAQTAREDPRWVVVNCGLGDQVGQRTLHVSGNSQSSSLLTMHPTHLAAAPDSAYVRDEHVRISTLSDEIDRYVSPHNRLFVKIDTQGSELDVIAGARSRLEDVAGWQVELSLVPLYEGQPLIEDVVALLRHQGFVPMSIEPDFADRLSGQLLQADGIFFRP